MPHRVGSSICLKKGMEEIEFDFRLESVLSMSSSGHKFDESICGTEWIVFRQRKDLAEYISISVTYLGVYCRG